MQTGVTMKFDGFFSWGILKVMGVFSEEVHVLLDSCLKKKKKKVMPGGTHPSKSSYLCLSWQFLLPKRKISPAGGAIHLI